MERANTISVYFLFRSASVFAVLGRAENTYPKCKHLLGSRARAPATWRMHSGTSSATSNVANQRRTWISTAREEVCMFNSVFSNQTT